jgi:hypothetical protein
MRTSLNDIQKLEKYLDGKLEPLDALLLEAHLLTNPLLRMNLVFQQKVHSLLDLYHRRKLKEEVEAVRRDLFNDPAKAVFQQTIYEIFK